jgi:hypothetical protein
MLEQLSQSQTDSLDKADRMLESKSSADISASAGFPSDADGMKERAALQEKETLLKAKCEMLRADAKKEAESLTAARDEAQAELDTCVPAFELGLRSVNSCGLVELQEAMCWSKCPPQAKVVMEILCHFLEVEPERKKNPGNQDDDILDYYMAAKIKIRSIANFFGLLCNYNKDAIEESIIRKVRPYMDGDRSDQFEHEEIEKIGGAGGKFYTAISLWRWVGSRKMIQRLNPFL